LDVSLFRAAPLAVLVLLACAPPPANAADQANTNDRAAEWKAAWDAAAKVATHGPAELKLLDEATLGLPGGETFVPAAETNRIMQVLGNGTNPNRYGLIVSNAPGAQWLIILSWVKEGYVRDGDAKEWQPDALLESLRDGTERGNTERLAGGLPAVDVVGWVEPPAYDGAAHRLVWSLLLRDRDASAARPQTVNYNTYALGRDGYFSLDLVTTADHVAEDKGAVKQLLAALNYVSGKRYDDFNASTDKVATYGLAALIGAVAVKKLGMLALFAAFFVKIWKVGMLVLLGAGAAVRRAFKRRNPPAVS
jgi:uncharacterized membrane-anchored protein